MIDILDRVQITLVGVIVVLGIQIARLARHRAAAERSKMLEQAEACELARSSERERIVRYLHDTFLQSYQIFTMGVQAVSQQLPKDSCIKGRLEATLRLAETLAVEGREELQGLARPRGPLYLVALEEKARGMALMKNISFTSKRSGDIVEMSAEANHQVTKIIAEALVNSFLHAQASHIVLAVEHDAGELVVSVQDDGKGLSVEPVQNNQRGHFGISIMQERAQEIAASLKFISKPGKGTTVELRVPLLSTAQTEQEVRRANDRPLSALTSQLAATLRRRARKTSGSRHCAMVDDQEDGSAELVGSVDSSLKCGARDPRP